MGTKTVYVLGAGFTKAFRKKAPLLIDDFGLEELFQELSPNEHPHARRLLRAELDSCGGRKANLEQLMTRLVGGMPYDRRRGAQPEIDFLLEKVIDRFLKRLKEAFAENANPEKLLHRFAKHCLESRSHCVTFNYDETMELALAEVSQRGWASNVWNPYQGFGFFCKGSHELIGGVGGNIRSAPMTVLKLHGSMRWRVRLGQTRPFMPDNIFLHLPSLHGQPSPYVGKDINHIEYLLESKPFIVPPVLTKAQLSEHPLLQVLWAEAFRVLGEAARVVFIGYSMPITDVGGGFLFREALAKDGQSTRITVVGYEPDEGKNLVRKRNYYKRITRFFRVLDLTKSALMGQLPGSNRKHCRILIKRQLCP